MFAGHTNRRLMATCPRNTPHFWRRKNPITEETAIAAFIEVLETSGVFETAIHEWEFKPAADQTYLNLVSRFTAANKQRLRKITTGQAGSHRSNFAMMAALTNALNQVEATTSYSQAAAAAAFVNTSNTTSNRKTNNTFKCFRNCGFFTQGNGHTGMDCQHPATGHIKTETVDNMQVENAYICRRSQEHPANPEC